MFKKAISVVIAILIVLTTCTSAMAFYFPEPDWGQLLREKQDMVMETEVELYGQASVESAPYYGAKFEPRGGAYIGSIPENSGAMMPLGSYLTYIEHMYQNDLYYPSNNMIRQDSVIATIGWTIHDMNTVDYSHVRNVLNTLNSYNKPMFIRFANEMNCSSLGDDPHKYIEVFRTVANMVHEYPNFAVVWAPNDLGALDRPFEYFYPGDEYVDWVGVSCYSVKYFVGNRNTTYNDSVYFMTGDFAWATNKIKPVMEFMEKNGINKPVMISEGGVATNNKYGDEYQYWNQPRLRNYLWYLIMKYPQIKLVNYIDTHRAGETERYDISGYQYAVDIFNEARTSGAYITEYNGSPEFVFQPVNNAGTMVAKNGKVKLYTYAYIPQNQDVTVNYYIDSNWYHSSNQIPYICNFDISSVADGKHTLEIDAAGKRKKYEFYKRGNAIRFGAEPDMNAVYTEPQPAPEKVADERITYDYNLVRYSSGVYSTLGRIFNYYF